MWGRTHICTTGLSKYQVASSLNHAAGIVSIWARRAPKEAWYEASKVHSLTRLKWIYFGRLVIFPRAGQLVQVSGYEPIKTPDYESVNTQPQQPVWVSGL